VTGVEIDPDMAEQARTNLATVNRPMTVITGDGTWGTQHGRPTRTRYGLTITPHIQTVWLDQPDNTVSARP
jgi:protein-L-isoaspartate O-methyltransferase